MISNHKGGLTMRSFLMTGTVTAALLLAVPAAFSQTTPFLNDNEIRMLTNEISGDRAYEHIRVLTRWHRNSGMEGYFKAAEYVMEAAREAGLEDVRFVEQPMNGPNYTARSAELWMVEPAEVKLADIGDHATHLADGSHDANVTAELVWIGNGSKEALKDLDVKGKIVLTSGPPGAALFNAVYEKGAVGVVTFQTAEGRNIVDAGDQIGWNRIPITPPEGKSGSFAFVLTPRMGEALKDILESDAEVNILASGKKAKGGRIVLKAVVDTEIGTAPGRTGFVEGWIRGSKYPNQQIVLTAHLQEEQGSANDDGSGCGNLLELARTFNKLIKEGKMPRPERSLRFWWVDEIYSEYRFWQDFPEEPKKILVNLHQDMTGANQAMGSRVQHLIFAPHSRTSYLDALFESIGTYVILTNNAFLAASRQGGLPRPFTRPIFSTRGSRQNYSARFVPYFGSSDHITFLDGPIGIPAVAMINWDDDYIHSSHDDLFQIDQTQLQRNNFIIGAMAYRLSSAGPRDVPLFASETYAQGLRRLANDVRVGTELIHAAEDGWSDAVNLVEQGVAREVRALISVRVLAGNDRKALETIDRFIVRTKERESLMLDDLKILYRQVWGKNAPSVKLTPAEQAAARKIPVNASNLAEYFANRQKMGFRAGGRLHGLMRSEVINFIDGRRSYYDIYKAVRAEALAAGSWYYGTVQLEDVVALLDAGVEAKAWTLKP